MIDSNTNEAILQNAAKSAKLADYTGSFTELGGGELNDTFLLHCDKRDVVIRISRYPSRNALRREARAFKLLKHVAGVPKLIFF